MVVGRLRVGSALRTASIATGLNLSISTAMTAGPPPPMPSVYIPRDACGSRPLSTGLEQMAQLCGVGPGR